LTAIPAKWYEPVKAILEEEILFDSGISERENYTMRDLD
jgi:hypothetical protein